MERLRINPKYSRPNPLQGTFLVPSGESLMYAQRSSHVRFFLAFWLFILSGVAFLDRTNLSIAGLQISKEYGLGNQRLGWIISAFLIGYAGFQLPAGWLATRFGPRRVLTLGVLWWGLTTALTALLPSNFSHALLLLIGIRLALGAGEAVVYPAANQFVARWVPQQERGLINGLIFAGVGVGSGLTPPLLTMVIADHGWRAAFWFSAIIGFFVGVMWWISARDTPDDHPEVSPEELRIIRRGLGEETNVILPRKQKNAASSHISWRAIFGRRDLVVLMAGYFCFGYIAWIYFGWFFIYMSQVRGFDPQSSALYTVLPFLSITVFCLAGGVMSDRLSKRHGLRVGRSGLAAVALLLTAVFLFLGAQTHNPQHAALILAGGAGTLYLSQSSFWSVSVDIAGLSSGIFSSLVNMGGQIGGAVTASLTPWIAQHFGWTVSFTVSAGLAVFGAVCWMTVHPERPLETQTA
jgi:ACS family glucarate transporter-like MFS transporter